MSCSCWPVLTCTYIVQILIVRLWILSRNCHPHFSLLNAARLLCGSQVLQTILVRSAGATAKQLQLVMQALALSQAAKALALSASSKAAIGSSPTASNGALAPQVQIPLHGMTLCPILILIVPIYAVWPFIITTVIIFKNPGEVTRPTRQRVSQ